MFFCIAVWWGGLAVGHRLSRHNADILRVGVGLHWRPGKRLPPADEIPSYTDGGKSGKDHRGIIHRRSRDGNCHRHAEQHDGKTDPAYRNDVDGEAEFAQRVRRVPYQFPSAQKRYEDRNPVGCGQADGCHTGEGVESGSRSEVYQPEQAIDGGRKDDAP